MSKRRLKWVEAERKGARGLATGIAGQSPMRQMIVDDGQARSPDQLRLQGDAWIAAGAPSAHVLRAATMSGTWARAVRPTRSERGNLWRLLPTPAHRLQRAA